LSWCGILQCETVTYEKGTPVAAQQRSYNVTWILSVLLGHFGVDRFYLGKIGTGILKLFFGAGIWYIIDLILILAGKMRDKEGRELAGYDQYKYLSWIVVAAVAAVFVFFGVIGFWFAFIGSVLSGHPSFGHWT
jgi:TM2 domain-containing membrane protein YozV